MLVSYRIVLTQKILRGTWVGVFEPQTGGARLIS